MITITQNAVWVKCRDCDRWVNITAQDATILYSFLEVPLLNWFFFECNVCSEDKHLFLLSYKDPEHLLAVLQDSSGVAEVAMELPSDMDLALFAASYGHIPQLHVRLYIETAVTQFAKELMTVGSPLELLE
jgi:hypothetical protein